MIVAGLALRWCCLGAKEILPKRLCHCSRIRLASGSYGSVWVVSGSSEDGDLMKHVVEFPIDDGGSVLVEIDKQAARPAHAQARRDCSVLAEEADKASEDASVTVTAAARSPQPDHRGRSTVSMTWRCWVVEA